MRLPSIHRRAAKPSGSGVVGLARVDGRTKNLTKRLQPGDVAVIDHLDIDTVAAEALVARRPGAVVNAVPSTSGRYPNLGPQILLKAGITLVDGVGPELMVRLRDGDRVRVDGGDIFLGDDLVGHGVVQTDETVAASMEEAREERPAVQRIREPEDVSRLFGARLRDLQVEEFHLIALDSQSQVLREVLITRGLLNSSLVHPREVFRAAIAEAAAGIIVVHNHPSGDPTPSAEDRAATKQLVSAGQLLDLPVYDHVIIAGDRFVSFAAAGLL